MKKIRKTFAFTLILFLLMGVFPVHATTIVASGSCGDRGENIKWTLDSDGLLTISGTGKMTESPWQNDYLFNVKNVVIRNGVLNISQAAFYMCRNLLEVTISDSVTSIEEEAFFGCSGLKKISTMNNVATIGDSAFSHCSSLEQITLSKKLTHIGLEAFFCCEKLSSITIPNGVTIIEYNTFSGCSDLKAIELPKSITSIGTWAFNGAKKLNDVYYTGTEREWNSIKINAGNDPLQTAKKHYNSTMTNSYNLGEETYSFLNYADIHDSGHCLGMTMTSSGYYLGILDVSTIGLESCRQLYSAKNSSTVIAPICYYQKISAYHYCTDNNGLKAGGTGNFNNDWNSAIRLVKNHDYDGAGSLAVIVISKGSGHAVNFLRYENVNGQDRIYAYDNEFPGKESFFYLSSNGIRQMPDGASYYGYDIDFLALTDVRTFFENAKSYSPTHTLYAEKGSIEVKGAPGAEMIGKIGDTQWMMYELPTDAKEATVTPLKNDATFTYMDKEYRVETDGDPYMIFPLLNISGDVSGDGEVTAEDARLALRAAVGLEEYAEGSAEFLAADVDKSDDITSADARLILRRAVGFSDPEFAA